MPNKVIYEQPLNERTRTMLRLEHLFRQIAHHMEGDTVWDSRAVLAHLVDILNIFGRSDLKSEVLKELERHMANLARMEQSPGVDHQRLSEVLRELGALSDTLYAQQGQTGAELRKNEFFKSIMQRSSIPGGTCAFDLPAYHCWLQKPVAERKRALHGWLSAFNAIGQAIQMILHLTRNSGTPTRELASGGFFQQSLDPNLPCQLIRVAVSNRYPFYPEISGGRHRFTVRFITTSPEGRAVQANQDIEFELTRCVI